MAFVFNSALDGNEGCYGLLRYFNSDWGNDEDFNFESVFFFSENLIIFQNT